MEWLVPHKLFVAQIQPFDELEEYAFKAIEKKEPVGDHKMVSIKREYSMDIPPRFERWLCNTIDTQFDLHKAQCGFMARTMVNVFVLLRCGQTRCIKEININLTCTSIHYILLAVI